MNTTSLPAKAIAAARVFGMDGSDHDERSVFARAIQARRAVLGLSQRDVYHAGGPATGTLVHWENGDELRTPPRPTTLKRLDNALRWPPGTASKLLEGKISAEEAQHSKPVEDQGDESVTIEEALDPATMMTEHSSRLMHYIMATLSLDDINPDLAKEGEELAEYAAEYYVTLLLQQHGGPNRVLPNEITQIVLPMLTAPEPERGSAEHTRWGYRRWLAGVPFTDERAQEFQEYWEKMNYRK